MSPLAKLESQIDKLNSLKTPKPLNRDDMFQATVFGVLIIANTIEELRELIRTTTAEHSPYAH